ncbi:MAG TPA: hypothetical protein VE075_09615, partial [Thermoanaerobaculia bacterium]|nr:hypothetical protein [Thermoanaerobaculia bacterium]
MPFRVRAVASRGSGLAASLPSTGSRGIGAAVGTNGINGINGDLEARGASRAATAPILTAGTASAMRAVCGRRGLRSGLAGAADSVSRHTMLAHG